MAATPANVAHPLAAPVVSGSTITVETMLKQPTRITKMIADLTLQKFVADRIFTSAGGVSGGAVVYDQVQANELYLTRDVERVAPGKEFPVVTSEELAPKVAEVEKWGGKTYITDEARDRNDAAKLANEVRKLANTIVRKVDQRAIAELEAAIATMGGATTVVGADWSAYAALTMDNRTGTASPAHDFARVQEAAEIDELGVSITDWFVNPINKTELSTIYGSALGQVLKDAGIRLHSSNRIAVGTAYAIAAGQVGQMRLEQPLGTETWREQGRQQTWIQSSVRPVMFVTNPYAVFKVTGL